MRSPDRTGCRGLKDDFDRCVIAQSRLPEAMHISARHGVESLGCEDVVVASRGASRRDPRTLVRVVPVQRAKDVGEVEQSETLQDATFSCVPPLAHACDDRPT
jgi:hypothetical protein